MNSQQIANVIKDVTLLLGENLEDALYQGLSATQREYTVDERLLPGTKYHRTTNQYPAAPTLRTSLHLKNLPSLCNAIIGMK